MIHQFTHAVFIPLFSLSKKHTYYLLLVYSVQMDLSKYCTLTIVCHLHSTVCVRYQYVRRKPVYFVCAMLHIRIIGSYRIGFNKILY